MRVNRFLMFRPEILNFCRGIPKSEENVDDRDRQNTWQTNEGALSSPNWPIRSLDCHESKHNLQSNVMVTLAPYGHCQASVLPRLLIGHCLTPRVSHWSSASGIISRVLPSPILLHTSSEVIRRRDSEDVTPGSLWEISERRVRSDN